jgi:hypothetical protein
MSIKNWARKDVAPAVHSSTRTIIFLKQIKFGAKEQLFLGAGDNAFIKLILTIQ